jgi:hypothetical protein
MDLVSRCHLRVPDFSSEDRLFQSPDLLRVFSKIAVDFNIAQVIQEEKS